MFKLVEKSIVAILIVILISQVFVSFSIGTARSEDGASDGLTVPALPRSSEDSAKIANLGPMQEGNVQFSILFNTRDNAKLQRFIDASHVVSHGVQTVLSEEEFETEYSPSQVDYNQVLSYLKENNLSVTKTWQNRLMINAEGTAKAFTAAFGAGIGLYSFGSEIFYANTSEVLVPNALSSLNIAGIDVNSFPAEPFIQKVFGSAQPNGIAYNKPPAEFRNAYGISTAIDIGWTGVNKTIGIVDAYGNPTMASDLNAFNTYFGLPSCSLTIAGTSGSNTGWATETAMDVEWAHAMAPGAAIILQVAATNSYGNLFGALNTLVSKTNPPDTISLSFGGSETSSYTSVFSAAAAKGIKIFVSTGDNGAYDGGSTLKVEYPASDPNAIAVGGSTLYNNTVQGTNQFYEYGWSGSGGGYSSIFSEPSYQVNAGIPDSTNKRAIPDICLNADPNSGVSIYVSGVRQSGWGGTSLSAPMMAGIAAVALNGNWNLDNYAFYSTCGTSLYPISFHDVYLSGNNGYYSVQTGWDAVTGLGSINFHNFANYYTEFSDIALTSQGLSSHSVIHGSQFSFTYDLDNPSAYSLIQVGLGASIRLHGTSTEIKDPNNDIYITLPDGESSQTRSFSTSSTLTPGAYDVQWGIWMGPPGYGNLVASSGWQSNQLQILSSSSEFDFYLSTSTSSQTISPGGQATYTVTSELTNGATSPISLSVNTTSGFTVSFSQTSGSPTFSSVFTVQTSSTVPQGKYTFDITGTGGGKTHDLYLTLNLGDTYEPDNSFTQYSTMTITSILQSQQRSIIPAGDNDYIWFYAMPGNYTFYTNSSIDTCGYLYASNQTLLAYNDDSGGSLQFIINYQIQSSGYYFLRVKDFYPNQVGTYSLSYRYSPAPLPPGLLNPINGAATSTNTVSFTWSNSPGANLYQLQILGTESRTANTSATNLQLSMLSQGAYTWKLRAYNASGWSDWTPEWGFIVDSTPPSMPTPNDGVSGWNFNPAPTFTWSANDALSGVAGYYWHVDSGQDIWTASSAVTIPNQNDGTHTFYVKAKDNAGNNGTYGLHSFQIDTTYPSGSIAISPAGPYITSKAVTLSLTFQDQTSGVDRVRFSNDDVWDTESWETPVSTKAWTMSAEDGSKTVYYQIRDNAGLLQNYSATTILDTIAPTGSITVNSGTAYCNSAAVTLSLTLIDTNAGGGQIRFSNNNNDWSSWQVFSATAAWTLQNGDGPKTVYVQLKDAAGLTSIYSNTITLDTTPPTVNAGSSQTVTQGTSVSFNGAGADSSGISSYVWDFGDSSTATGATASHTYASTGTFTARLTVTDAAGNTAYGTVNITVQSPTPTPSPSSSSSSSSSSSTSSTGKTSSTTSTPTPTPTATPTPTPNNSEISVTNPDGSIEQLTITGNITSTQISNAQIQVNETAKTTTISFTITGEAGTTGTGTITVPKSQVPYGSTPTIYIDNLPVDEQSYTEDADNYYVTYSTHFSTHQVSIVFEEANVAALDYTVVIVAVVVVLVVVLAVVAVVLLRRGKTKT